MNKQTVYIPTKVEDELPSETGYYKTMEEGTSFFQKGNQNWYSDDINSKSRFPIHWLKPTEAYVFTPEELKQLLSEYTNRIVENGKCLHTGYGGYTINKESITSQLPKFLKEKGL